jgi:glycosyltransferase involved in cell wall biosynthesis
MKVMIVARGYPTDKYKMNGIFEFDQAKALTKAGIDVFYVAIDVRSIRRWRKWGIEKKIIEGVKIYAINIPCGNISKKIRNKISIWALKELFEIVKFEYGEPDIIHAHFIGIGCLVSQVFKESKIPLVLTEHYSGMNQKNLSKYYTKIGELTYSRMDKVLAVSDYLANNIKEKFNIDVITVPNIIDLSKFIYTSRNRTLNTENYNFISVGRLHSDKRIDLLIEAFYKVFKETKDVSLYIFGDGPDRKVLEKMICQFKLEDKVFLMGLADRGAIAKTMSHSNCFVLPSRLETFGVAYIEAMAMGLPVIAAKSGGPEGFINEQNGIIVPVDSKEKLESALLKMYENMDYYNRDKIAETTRLKFSEENLTKKLIYIYETSLSRKD